LETHTPEDILQIAGIGVERRFVELLGVDYLLFGRALWLLAETEIYGFFD
jgi:hypothetical protein